MHTKNVKMVKSFFPLEPSTRWLGDGRKKKMISAILAKVKGLQSQKYKKNDKKGIFRCRFEGRLTFWLATWAKWVEIGKSFFPPKPDLAGLMIGPKTLSFWPFWPKL